MHKFAAARLMLTLVSLLLLACGCVSLAPLPFRDPTLPPDARVRDLVNRLSNSELIDQIVKGGAGPLAGPASAIPRLGISPFQWDTECLHGIGFTGPATSFPQAIGLAATGSEDLLAAMAYATALEVRASHNRYKKMGNFKEYTGINCFAPVINIMRHPLWGRSQESYGEDPFMTGVLSVAYVHGLQGSSASARQLLGDWGSRYSLAGANCKHFAAYAGPENVPESRVKFNAEVPEQDLHQTFLPAFKRCLEAGSHGIMCSYNSVNGVPACANKRLLTDILRDQWQFDGFVVSDQGALELSVDSHKFFPNYTMAAVGSLKAGVNVELSPHCTTEDCIVFHHLYEAFDKGMVTREELLEAARPLFLSRLRLGEFDPPGWNPYEQLIPSDFVQSQRHQALSAQLTAASVVLLKNFEDFLPLALSNLKIGLIGPFAADMSLMYGAYSGNRMPEFETSLPDGLRLAGARVTTGVFCLDGVLCHRQNASAVKEVVSNSDVLVAAVGNSVVVETEGNDRVNMSLPDGQNRLLQSLADSGKPVILLAFTGSPVLLDSMAESENVRAILWCGYPGQAAGLGVTDVLTGSAPPFARLPFTWYSVNQTLAPITNYTITNMTYRFLSERPLFPFGFGLSFADCHVSLSNLQSPSSLPVGSDLLVNFTASLSPTSTAQVCLYSARLYLRPVQRVGRNPFLWQASVKLLHWESESLKQLVTMKVEARDTQQWQGDSMKTLSGQYDVIVGDYFDENCADCRLVRRITFF